MAGAIPFRKLFKYADAWDLLMMALGTMAAAAHGLVLPANMFLFGTIINALGTNQSDPVKAASLVMKAATAMFIVAANSGWISWLEVWCWMHTGERQCSRIRVKYLEALLHQDIAFFDTEIKTGDIVSHISSDMLLVQDAMGEKVGVYIHNMSTFVAGIGVALFTGWQIALLAIATVPLLAGTGAVYTSLYTSLFAQSQASRARASSVAEQAVSQIRTVYSYVGESKALASFSSALSAAKEIGGKSGLVKGVGLGVTLGIVNCSWALDLWYGSILVSKGHSNGGKILTTVFCVAFGGMALGQTVPELQVFSQGRVAAFKIFDIIDRSPKTDRHGGKVLEELKGSIDFNNVSFHYPSRPDVGILKDLSLHVPAARAIALVGGSGSGKTTVLSLIQRFYAPASGEILIDGQNIQHLQLHWLRTQIGMVGQEPALFAASIKDNIKLGRQDATDDEVEAAAQIANAYAFVKNLPEGFDTQIGQGVSQLSGGQKQRIAIARAVLKNPTILLLDEATSALDVESEHMVKSALDKLMVGRTTVTIAHRLSTIQDVEAIAVFVEGKIAELGTHSELVAKQGAYSKLVHLQEASFNEDNQQTEDTSYSFQSNSDASIGVHRSLISEKKTGREDAEPAEQELKVNIWKALWRLGKLGWFKMSIGSVAAAVTGCINPLFALFLIEVVQLYYTEPAKRMRQRVNTWCIAVTALGATAICTNIAQHYLFASASEDISQGLETTAFRAILKNEVAWFDDDKNSSHALSAKLATNATKVRRAVSDRACLLLQYATSICLAVTLGFWIKWEMAVITIATFPFSMIGGAMRQGFLQKGFAGDLEQLHAKASNIAGEAAVNIRTLASFCAEGKIIALFRQQLEGPLKQGLWRAHKSGIMFGLSQCGLHFANAVGLWYISILVKNGQSNYSDALKVFQILAWTGYVLAEALSLVPDMINAVQALASLQRVTARQTRIDPDDPHGKTLDRIEGSLEFCNLGFSYPSRPLVRVLKDFNLRMEPGTTTALVGPSGCGKSSVIGLIMRFYDPDSGVIKLDNYDIRGLNLRWMRQQISLVQQEPVLFEGSIRFNIAYGKDNATEHEITRAAMVANAHTFISSLPEAYETQVGERGVQLSGGQKQRIAIARAVLRTPKLLLLDEATSALDTESERIVQGALDQVLLTENKRTTVLIVAHRLSSITNAHSISVLQSGHIVEQGSHEELLKRDGAYAAMAKLARSGTLKNLKP